MLANKTKHSPVVFQTLLRIRIHFLKKKNARKIREGGGHFPTQKKIYANIIESSMKNKTIENAS